MPSAKCHLIQFDVKTVHCTFMLYKKFLRIEYSVDFSICSFGSNVTCGAIC